ncbi:MAG: hypothetical protein U5K71_09015 [Gracilimonas sp.]|nr:hypothetical protein [Gracilimonas sp.]
MKRTRFKKIRLVSFLTAMAVLILGLESFSRTANAQGVVNINVTGIPGVINTPFVDEFEQNFRNSRYQVIFTYNNSNPQPVDFTIQVQADKRWERNFRGYLQIPEVFSLGPMYLLRSLMKFNSRKLSKM